MRKKILWISQLIMAAVLIIYTVLSTQVFYGGLVENRKESLKVYMNLFDAGEYAWDDVGANAFSQSLSGLRVTFMDREGNVLGDSEGKISAIMPTAKRCLPPCQRARDIPSATALPWARI
ncbi:MAG: hypothetical protein ACLR06_00205 [Christensenellaceae bacterium]